MVFLAVESYDPEIGVKHLGNDKILVRILHP